MKFPVALQLYSVRTDMEADALTTLKAVKAMGYDGVELAGLYGNTPAQMKAWLDEAGLTPISAHVPMNDLLGDTDKVLADYKAIGVSYIVIPSLSPEQRPGGTGFEQCLKELSSLAEKCNAAGMPLQYHNHDFEFCNINGKYGLQIMLDTVPVLGMQLDTCWSQVGGANSGKLLRSYKGRAPLLHLKDYYREGDVAGKLYNLIGVDENAEAEKDTGFELRPLGKGLQDIDALLCAARHSDVKWLIVEQDEPSMGLSRMECAKASAEYLATLNPQRWLRVGAVGCGNIFMNAHLPGYNMISNAKVVAVCDINEDRAKAAAEKIGLKTYYLSVEQMCEEAEIDSVDVCTWNNGHAPCSIAGAMAGKHVMCEKPMARSAAEAREMEKAVKENGVGFMLAVPGRFGNANQYIRNLYDKGELGEVYYGKTAYIRRRGTPLGWFTDLEHAGGGPVYDIGIHGIDAAWYLMGNPKPVRVSAIVNTQIGDYQTKGVTKWQGTPCPDNQFNVEDSGMGVIHFENGAMLTFEASWALNAPDGSSTQICGSKAGATVNPLTIYGEREGFLSTDNITVIDNNRFAAEIEHFADKMLNGGEVRYPIEQAIQMQEMLDAIYLSGKEGREVII